MCICFLIHQTFIELLLHPRHYSRHVGMKANKAKSLPLWSLYSSLWGGSEKQIFFDQKMYGKW